MLMKSQYRMNFLWRSRQNKKPSPKQTKKLKQITKTNKQPNSPCTDEGLEAKLLQVKGTEQIQRFKLLQIPEFHRKTFA
jgi:hypothetical protein